jgi:hypothetical protein
MDQESGKNISGKPIVAYVVVDAPTSSQDYRTRTLHAVFTNGDSMRPGSSINMGSFERRRAGGSLSVDYVRTSDGATCGKAESSDAKAVSARSAAQ